MSGGEQLDSDRRTFLKQFAISAAAVPFVTHGVFRSPNISGWGSRDGYGYGHGYGEGYRCGDGYGEGYREFDDDDSFS